MTEVTSDPYPGSSSTLDPAEDASTRDVAKGEARGVAQDAAQAGRQTVETAKHQAGQVVGEATSQAKTLLEQARTELTGQGSAQKERATSGLRSLADELGGMSRDGDGAQAHGVAGDLVREASSRVQQVADWLESREPADVLEDVKSFARRRPGVFLLSAAALGFVGGRITRSVAAQAREGSSQPSLATADLSRPAVAAPSVEPTVAPVAPNALVESVDPVDPVLPVAPAAPVTPVTSGLPATAGDAVVEREAHR
jgi:hypothetical protein